eukprot:scaffold7025_cov123-Cylindrotheca_fusiformis.AAC.12
MISSRRWLLTLLWVMLGSRSVAFSWTIRSQQESCRKLVSTQMVSDGNDDNADDRVIMKPVAVSGLEDAEIPALLKAVHDSLSDCNTLREDHEVLRDITLELSAVEKNKLKIFQDLGSGIVGATERALLLETKESLDEGMIEFIQYAISEKVDQLLYSTIDERPLRQPVLITIRPETESDDKSELVSKWKQQLQDTIREQIEVYEIKTPLPRSERNDVLREDLLTPTVRVELDGDYVNDESSKEQVWDTSTVLVFDDLVSEDLRKRLLDVTLGRSDGDNNHWDDDMLNGPNPERWVRGGLVDTPEEEEEDDEDESSTSSSTSWGLSDEGIDDICFNHHDAIEEFETIISHLFPQFLVTRLPEAVFGSTVSPLTANAPTARDRFDYHIDGDPNQTPPSPWTDVYGRYPNRIRGKPRFMSCLLYLNDHWEEEWGAPTRFLDIPTNMNYEVIPKPGRCVFMDQDCSHTVVAPEESAGKNRPRYSLVWKLILHPRVALQDMTDLAGGTTRIWPEPVLFGSANRSSISR